MFKKKYFISLVIIAMILMTGCNAESSSSVTATATAAGTTAVGTTSATTTPTVAPTETPKDVKTDPTPTPVETTPQTSATPKANVANPLNPIVTIEMQDGAKIKIELYPSVAPNTVENFISLVQKGFYNGLIFHRVIPGFMIQGGDPLGTGTGGADYDIKGEFSGNGFNNPLKHTKGVISMARTSAPNSANSQFFIMAADSPSLDGQYAAFGKVLEGLEEVDKIVSTPRDTNDKPTAEQKMKTVTVDTKGVKYNQPDIIKQ